MNHRAPITAPITIVLANRPRLFRELLHHALITAASQDRHLFNVLEVTDALSTASALDDAHWLLVDEDDASDATKLAAAHPDLKILAIKEQGQHMHRLDEAGTASTQVASPKLDDLMRVLVEELPQAQPEPQS